MSGLIRQIYPNYPVILKAEFSFDEKAYSLMIEKTSEASGENGMDWKLPQYLQERFEQNREMPLLCYMSAGKGRVSISNKESVTISTGEIQRISGYRNLFSDNMDFDSIQQWCIQMEFAEFQRGQKIREYQQFLNIISDFMQSLEKTKNLPWIRYSSEVGAIVYKDDDSIKPVYQLSDGYQSVLCLIMELAYRAVLLNPALENCGKKNKRSRFDR